MAKSGYAEKWIRGDKIGGGGQAFTYFAISNPNDGKAYALKVLKEQKNHERRERMFLEVGALKTLQHSNIPKFIDSNAYNYEDIREELFLVMEYIPGHPLEEDISAVGPLSLGDAINVMLSLSGTLSFCHEKGFCHRDIKPDNIILRDGLYDNPCLIDFGLSFNEDIEVGITPSWQHIGNRFLSLPELRVRDGNKRDPRSDVTMLCGIFLFCLTGIHPTDLLDENNAKPHRRKATREILEKLDTAHLQAINRIFDIGFKIVINERWQSVEVLRQEISQLLKINPKDHMESENLSKRLEYFKKDIESREDFKYYDLVQSIFTHFNNVLILVANTTIDKLKPSKYGTIHSDYNFDIKGQSFSSRLGIKHPYDDSLTFWPVISLYFNGSELVMEGSEEGNRSELVRVTMTDNIITLNWGAIQEALQAYYLTGVISKGS